MTELYDAILAARQANPGAFQNVSSNYLLGLVQQAKITPNEFANLAQTNTVVLSTNNNNGGTSSLQKGLQIISSVVNKQPLDLSNLSPVPSKSNPSGNPNIVNSDGTPVTTEVPALKQAIDAIKTNFQSIGIGTGGALLALLGIGAFVLLRRK